MDEKTWLSSDKPEPMLECVHDDNFDGAEAVGIPWQRASLYSCRCVRRIRSSLVYQESLDALRFAEDILHFFTEGEGWPTQADMVAHRNGALRAIAGAKQEDGPLAVAGAQAAAALLYEPSESRIRREAFAISEDPSLFQRNWIHFQCQVKKSLRISRLVRGALPPEKRPAERQAQARLVRCILGNPWRRCKTDPLWLSPNLVDIAQAIYTKRSFKDLPVLADALEDVGCVDAAILDHCRGEGPHGRGCWVVDLLLGKTRDKDGKR